MGTTGFWQGKRVLVTGHTGFKGAWLTRWLVLSGADVAGYSLAPDSDPSLFELCGLSAQCKSTLGDVRDLAQLSDVVGSHRPEIVFHLAAQALVRRSYREPVNTYATNVLGTVNLLEALHQTRSARAIVVVTTDKCYENREWDWPYREVDSLGGRDPYSSSKACAELVAAAYRRSFFESGIVATARAGNVIGGGDWSEDRLLPDIVRGARDARSVLIRNPASTRPWQHVLEPLAGYRLLAERLWDEPRTFAEAWNFGPRDEGTKPVGQIAEQFVRALGAGSLELGTPDPSAPHEAGLLQLDAAKARTRLGWTPRLDIQGALQLTADWYKAYLADSTTALATLDDQIGKYEGLFA